MPMQDLAKLLRGNPYPGRGIVVGKDRVYYFIMGRSINSRNRIFALTEDGIRTAIEGYTKEAGVRTLERTIGSVCRKVAVKYADHPKMKKVNLTKKKVVELLGAPMYALNEENRPSEVGAVNGLAWTAYGGTTLTVEATRVDGKGEILLTGKLGDVMKESARAALTFVRANAEEYGIDKQLFETQNVHVHVPEGATPKDGPSAGITMATAILSVFTGKKVRSDIAMTGEITLRGKVLPIGGLKEKALAAVRAGIHTVIIPKANERDIKDIPAEIAKDIRFIPVTNVSEVFAVVFEK
jgi:ATP-dependent Lon protease